MPRYVDVESLNLYDDLFMKSKNDSGVWVRYRDVENLLKNAPAADVQEVRHAKWITKEPLPRTYGRSRAMCERCGGFALYEFINAGSFGEQLSKYCPYCGAKMDLKERLNNE